MCVRREQLNVWNDDFDFSLFFAFILFDCFFTPIKGVYYLYVRTCAPTTEAYTRFCNGRVMLQRINVGQSTKMYKRKNA